MHIVNLPRPTRYPGPPPQGIDGIPVDPGQQLLTSMTERIEKELQVRNDLINQIPASDKVKALLYCLTGFEHRVIGGEWHLTLSWKQIGERLLKAVNTVKTYVRQAAPYVEIIGVTDKNPNTKHTFVVHWLAILDRDSNHQVERAANRTVSLAPSLRAADRTADDEIRMNGGCQIDSPRVSEMTPEGVNFGVGGCQNEGVNFPHTPSKNLLQREQITNSLLLSSKPSSQPSSGSVPRSARRSNRSSARLEMREKTRAVCWPLWERAVCSVNLADPEHVQRVYAIAVELEIVEDSEVNRFQVFYQAAKQVRMVRTGLAKSRTGLFVSNVAQNNWMRNDEDEDTARHMIARVDLHRPAQRDKDIELACVGAIQNVATDDKPLTKEQCDAKKELVRIRLAEKFPDLFNVPY